jgi:hypothetical protein
LLSTLAPLPPEALGEALAAGEPTLIAIATATSSTVENETKRIRR